MSWMDESEVHQLRDTLEDARKVIATQERQLAELKLAKLELLSVILLCKDNNPCKTCEKKIRLAVKKIKQGERETRDRNH